MLKLFNSVKYYMQLFSSVYIWFLCAVQRSEQKKLTSERIKLNQMKMKVWQSYSGLYERVCTEADLRPEQLQVLAKYSSPDCPLSAFMCPSPDLSQSPQASDLSTHTSCSGAKPPVSSSMENTVAQSSSQNRLPLGVAEAQSHCLLDASLLECSSTVKLTADLLISNHETHKLQNEMCRLKEGP